MNQQPEPEPQTAASARLKNTALSHLRGFSYHPSFCAHGLVRWLDRYDAATVILPAGYRHGLTVNGQPQAGVTTQLAPGRHRLESINDISHDA